MVLNYLRSVADREPTVILSGMIIAIGIGIGIVVPPIRRSMGLPTDQLDGFKPKLVKTYPISSCGTRRLLTDEEKAAASALEEAEIRQANTTSGQWTKESLGALPTRIP